MKKESFVFIYAAEFPFKYDADKYLFEPRAEEISSCNNIELREQKFFVWKLLEYAVLHGLGSNVEEMNFKKNENGKLIADKYCFSLTHCKGVVAVAISDKAIGVDVEEIEDKRFGEALKKKIIYEDENEQIKNYKPSVRACILWTKKESIFKRDGGQMFRPCNIDTRKGLCRSFFAEGNSKHYIFSLAGESAYDITFFSPFSNIIWGKEIK